MAQRVRRQKNRKKVIGVAIKKNNNPNVVRTVTKKYGNVKVITYKKKGDEIIDARIQKAN